MIPLVVAIDPPQGWAIWGPRGPVAAGEGVGATARAARINARANLKAFFLQSRMPIPRAACVELTYGGRDSESAELELKVKALIENARGVGWWEAVLEEGMCCPSIVTWMGNEWRPLIGIKGRTRDDLKNIAVKLGRKAFTETLGRDLTGPRGGVLEHACEALCQAMALWNRLELGMDDPLDSLMLYRTTHSFRGSYAEAGAYRATLR